MVLTGVMLVWMAPTAQGREPLEDRPVVWYAEDDHPIPVPAEAEPGLVPYAVDAFVGRPFSRFWNPMRFGRWIGTGYRAADAPNVNSLDEVVNSTWFTNRIGLFPLNDTELATGPAAAVGAVDGPDRSRPWTIIGAKTAGITPGFRIRDGRGQVWLLKFDTKDHPGMTIRAGVVANLMFHAMGYNVPVDQVVEFELADLVVGEGATMKLPRWGEVPMTTANLDSVLTATRSIFKGKFHALASRYLDGVPIGPFDDEGRRIDDPNDLIRHQDRRELRALRVFASWINHFDTKMQNSLDMYVGEPDQGHVRHYLIDFASTLGAYGDEPVKRFGYEFGVDVFPVIGRTFTFGFREDPWIPLERATGLEEVGLLDVETFEPAKWKPDLPHSAMANLTRRDGYWAAKIVSSFSDAQLRVLVKQGRYQNPEAVDYLVTTLAGRRDKIVRYWFSEVPPLDYFKLTAAGLGFRDLGVERGYSVASDTRYRVRLAAVDTERSADEWTDWEEITQPEVDLEDAPPSDRGYPFLAVEVQLNRGQGWSKSTTVYLAVASGHVVALDR